MRQRLTFFALAVAALAAVAIAPGAQRSTAAPAPCDPMQTPSVFRGAVPTSEQVLGFPLGSREVTAAEANAYVDAVDAASDRVVSGTFGATWQGRQLRYTLVGDPKHVTPSGLAALQDALGKLRDPETSARDAERLARTTPVVLWLMGNVHGGEESATDAELRVLYELADRDDCAARQILDNAVIGIIPTQNPDGREAETRQNSYGFDMNRDWFARTQVETDTKLELLRRYPGMLYVDAHEMGANHYFFPPTADPTYHEITAESMRWQDFLYGDALAAEFKRQHISYFTNKVFDFFAMVYGDTVPATAFGAAGMTFEKASFDPIAQRTYEHYVTHWVSISQGALNRENILHDWHGVWVEAFRQGLAGELEPNEVNDKGNTVQLPVPDEKVRHYFLRADDESKAAEVQQLVRRLQRMDVRVYRLSASLAVPDFKPYGRPAGATVLPAGTYWIPLAQGQKHWIQALLNENTYVPFPVLLRRQRLEQSAPLQRRRRTVRRRTLTRSRASGPARSARCAAAAGPAAPRRGLPDVGRHVRVRVDGLAPLPARAGVGSALRADHLRADRRRGPRRLRRAARSERGFDDRLERARAVWEEGAAGLDQRGRLLHRLARRRRSGSAARAHDGADRGAALRRRRRADPDRGRSRKPTGGGGRRVQLGLLRLRRRHDGGKPGARCRPLPRPRERGLLRLRLRPGRVRARRHGGHRRRACGRRPRRPLLDRPELPRLDARHAEDAAERESWAPKRSPARRRVPDRRDARPRRRSPRTRPGRLRRSSRRCGSASSRGASRPRAPSSPATARPTRCAAPRARRRS